MPEGHTIHRIARDHTKLLVGREVAVSSPQGRFVADAERVDGSTLERIEPYGKHLCYLMDKLRYDVANDAVKVVSDYLPQLVAATAADSTFEVKRDSQGRITRIDAKSRG